MDLQDVGRSELPIPTSRQPDLLTSLILTRHPEALAGWVDRLYLLRDGRLRSTSLQPARRVAERGATVR
jgi:hypothetical protein